MKILSIFTLDPTQVSGPPNEEQMAALIAEMKSSGALIDTGGAMDGTLEMRISRKDGKTTVTDGPFTESKEVVGGYALLEMADREDAIRWTNRFLDLVGNATCHLHEVSSA